MKLVALALIMGLAGCRQARAASYGGELAHCNHTAKTCEESIACENDVRSRYNRPLRTGDCK